MSHRAQILKKQSARKGRKYISIFLKYCMCGQKTHLFREAEQGSTLCKGEKILKALQPHRNAKAGNSLHLEGKQRKAAQTQDMAYEYKNEL